MAALRKKITTLNTLLLRALKRVVRSFCVRIDRIAKFVTASKTFPSRFVEGEGNVSSIDSGDLDLTSVSDLLKRTDSCRAIHIPEIYVDLVRHELSKLPSNPIEGAFYESRSFRAPEMMLDRLEYHYWFPESGFLVSRAGKFWHHSVLGQFVDPHFLTTHAIEERRNHDTPFNYIFHESVLRNARKLNGTHLVTSHYASHNFGHFMLDMVPLIAFGQQHDLTLLTRPLLDWQKKIYDLFEVRKDKLSVAPERVYFLESVIVSNRHNAESTYAASPRHRDVFEEFRSKISLPDEFTSYGKKIFVSRGNSKNRRLRNRDALWANLKGLGFSVVQPDLLSIEAQVAAFSNADLIVTEFGAVMTNVVFCKRGTKVIEIVPEGQNDPWSVHLCASMEFEHVVLFQPVADIDREKLDIGGRIHTNIFFEYDVDVDAVINAVKNI